MSILFSGFYRIFKKLQLKWKSSFILSLSLFFSPLPSSLSLLLSLAISLSLSRRKFPSRGEISFFSSSLPFFSLPPDSPLSFRIPFHFSRSPLFSSLSFSFLPLLSLAFSLSFSLSGNSSLLPLSSLLATEIISVARGVFSSPFFRSPLLCLSLPASPRDGNYFRREENSLSSLSSLVARRSFSSFLFPLFLSLLLPLPRSFSPLLLPFSLSRSRARACTRDLSRDRNYFRRERSLSFLPCLSLSFLSPLRVGTHEGEEEISRPQPLPRFSLPAVLRAKLSLFISLFPFLEKREERRERREKRDERAKGI